MKYSCNHCGSTNITQLHNVWVNPNDPDLAFGGDVEAIDSYYCDNCLEECEPVIEEKSCKE